MSLIKCPECKKKISSESRACVHCGFPVPENYIDTTPETSTLVINKPKWLTKRLIIIISVIIGIILLSVGGILVYRQTTIAKFKDIITKGLVSYEKEAHNNDSIKYEDVYNLYSIVGIYKHGVKHKSLIEYGIYREGTIYYTCHLFVPLDNERTRTAHGYYDALVEYDISSGEYILLYSHGAYSYDELSLSETWTRII